jgi:hypothetical protein
METNAIKRDFGSNDRSDLFQRNVGSPLLHNGYAKNNEKYHI